MSSTFYGRSFGGVSKKNIDMLKIAGLFGAVILAGFLKGPGDEIDGSLSLQEQNSPGIQVEMDAPAPTE